MLRARRRDRLAAGKLKLEPAEAEISGELAIEAKSASKSFATRAIIKNLSIRILRGDRLGIAGPNGAGKTTLIRLLTRELDPDRGNVRLGANIALAALDQDRASLREEAVLKDVLTGGGSDFIEINGERRHVGGFIKDLLFSPEQARTPAARLSGGERARLMLARVLVGRPSNLLVLDEPTNDLDLETLDLLQKMLSSYRGTLLLVSHDRDFLDRGVTSVLVPEGDGNWTEYAGGYSDMIRQRGCGPSARPPEGGPRTVTAGSAASRPQKAAAKRRLGFNEKQALAALSARIEEPQSLTQKLHAPLGDAELYRRDPEKFARAAAALAKAEGELAAAEEEWLRLELLREEAGG